MEPEKGEWTLIVEAIREWVRHLRGRRPPRSMRFAFHGRFCGPGHGDIRYDLCEDALDCACARHDRIYRIADALELGTLRLRRVR